MRAVIKILFSFILFLPTIFFYSCDNNSDPTPGEESKSGHIIFNFNHYVDGKPLEKDKMLYVNAAGNPYEIDELMYFISDVKLHKSDGSTVLIDDWKDIDYVDIDIPSTLTWDVFDSIPVGEYDSISFTFGISEEKNKSFMYVNPPEDKMMWPDILGGGYHYMMINGKWLDENDQLRFFNFHMGIGQLYKGDEGKFAI